MVRHIKGGNPTISGCCNSHGNTPTTSASCRLLVYESVVGCAWDYQWNAHGYKVLLRCIHLNDNFITVARGQPGLDNLHVLLLIRYKKKPETEQARQSRLVFCGL